MKNEDTKTTEESTQRAESDSVQRAVSSPNNNFEGLSYAVSLQQAIEYHCNARKIPEALAAKCPHHAKMLNANLD